MDVFVSILKENCDYDMQSVVYQYFQIAVEAVKSKESIAILVCLDTLETIQPDCNICGVYAAAIASYMLLKGDPSKITFSMDALRMRKHLFNILQTKKLSQFPIKNA
ncbi:hypothetical protein TSAR_005221 [Trichomalopsis sarcophagae]|uniref:Ubiquitin-like protease family profile domain-containing protein n=1 Tax=Trichomalopsis sarcophagae TaxID=543379 RepID=A0A232ELK6_9HYME|nr:hypothetical protein TSAR_005221 [Trichomalopsis sarcophagae]